jgi:tripartite-type tricarboxylate transporter receptor subunit TctC
MPLGRRALLALPALLAGRGIAAEVVPPGPVTLLVGAPPARAADTWARGFAPFLERHWPRSQVAVVNRPGEGGMAAARAVAATAPESWVIGAVSTPLLLARAVERNTLGLLDRLQFLAVVAEEPVVLVGPGGGAADSLSGLRALGDGARIATPPPGSAAQLAAASLGARLGLDLLAFPNAAAARQAVLAGNVPAAMLALPEAVAGLRDGRLLALGQARHRRSALLPEVATLREQGVALSAIAHRGFVVPAGLEAARLAPLLRALQAAVEDPEFTAQAEADGYEARFIGPTEWEPQRRRMTVELAERWVREPWVTQRD